MCHIRKAGPEIRDFWWDSRPGTLKVGPETRDQEPSQYLGHETRDPIPKTMEVVLWTRDPQYK